MTPQELKNSILQLALQGKLVEQRPEEGTAEELFARIQAEKQRLIAEKKIKKEKSLPEITEEEKPFDIPESWKWVRLGELFQHNTGKALNSTNRMGICLKYITTSNLYWNRFELEHLREMFFADSEIEKCTAQKGDLLVCEGGDIGRAAIWQNDETICIQNHIHRLRAFSTVCTEFFYYLFYLYKHAGWIGGKGIGIQGLSSKAIHVLVFPLPPLAEQKRIVAKIEELLPYIERYEQAWSKLEQFNSRFPEDMKKSLLQHAIQGKLVEQRPEEGTAEELFDQIQEEKQQLIAEKKIKKEKPLPKITEDEKTFDIPESWKWVKLGEIAMVLGGKRIPAGRTLTTENTGHKYIRVSDMKDGTVLADGLLYVPADIYPSIARYIIHKEDIYITVAGTIGRVGKIPAEADGANLTENADRLVLSRLNQDWLIKCLESNIVQSQIANVTTKVGQPKLAIKRIQELLIPLAPLAEQKRIAAKFEQLLPLCEQLKKGEKQ